MAELAERGANSVGVEVNDQMVTVARRRPPGAYWNRRRHRLPVPEGAVAGYRANKVFHELDDPARALQEAWRMLVPVGRIVLIGEDWDGS